MSLSMPGEFPPTEIHYQNGSGVSKSVENSFQRRSRSICSGVESVNRHLDCILSHCLTVPGVYMGSGGDREWQGEPDVAFPPITML